MTAQEIRQAYLKFFQNRGHTVISRARIVPDNDPTTLFTGSGMQPLLSYLLGEKHPSGNRLVDSQTCFRAEDIDEVGDNRHTTFFEMLGNWSLGDYFKEEQINWFWEFLTEVVKLDPNRIYVTCYIGNKEVGIPKDTQSGVIWKEIFTKAGVDAKEVEIGSEEKGYELGEQNGRILYYAEKNWWSRVGTPQNMPEGEPGGPDTEAFYLYPNVQHDKKWGEQCHPNCDCGRYIELGNSVFMEYVKTKDGFGNLPNKNVDYGGGLERIAAAAIDSPDVFKISLLWPIIERLQELSSKNYEDNVNAMRIISDHMRAAVFMAADGVTPSNKTQGYILRRLLRRAIRHGLELGVESGLLEATADTILDMYKDSYPELMKDKNTVISVLAREEKAFRQTLRKGLRELDKNLTVEGLRELNQLQYRIAAESEASSKRSVEYKASDEQYLKVPGWFIFKMFDTHGFPSELTKEELRKRNLEITDYADKEFEQEMKQQQERSRSATKGMFKGGLAEHSEQTIKYHTATHLMYRALRLVLGDHVEQRGSNITNERLRFDFNHHLKMTPEEIKKVEDIVNEQIAKDLPVTWEEMPTKQALATGARGHFGEKYGDTVKVYIMGPKENPYTMELCGGPHAAHTGTLGEGGKQFKIIKEESSAAGIRRIKAVLQ